MAYTHFGVFMGYVLRTLGEVGDVGIRNYCSLGALRHVMHESANILRRSQPPPL